MSLSFPLPPTYVADCWLPKLDGPVTFSGSAGAPAQRRFTMDGMMSSPDDPKPLPAIPNDNALPEAALSDAALPQIQSASASPSDHGALPEGASVQPAVEYRLAPPEVDPETAPRGGPLTTRQPEPYDPDVAPEQASAANRASETQFSLAGLLLITAAIALLLWPARLLSRPVYALLIGVGCAGLLLVTRFWRSDLPLFRVGWWLLLLLYLAMSTMAVMGW